MFVCVCVFLMINLYEYVCMHIHPHIYVSLHNRFSQFLGINLQFQRLTSPKICCQQPGDPGELTWRPRRANTHYLVPAQRPPSQEELMFRCASKPMSQLRATRQVEIPSYLQESKPFCSVQALN